MQEVKTATLEKKTDLSVIVEQSGLEQTKGQQLLEMFTPYFQKMAEIETKINSLNSENPQLIDVRMSREIRLALRNNRVNAEKVKTEQKAMILIEGRVIDHLFGLVRDTSKPLEIKCENIEKFAEIQEQKRKEERKTKRLELLKPYELQEPYNSEPGYFSFNYDLLNMQDNAFEDLLESVKLHVEKIKAEKLKAEAERIAKEKADAEERERMRIENARLKKEAIEREKKAEIERKKQAKILAEQKAKADAERKILEDKAKKEAIEREKLQKELQAKKDAEEKARLNAEAEKKAKADYEKKLARQPDKKKLEDFARLTIGKLQLPDVKSEEAKKIISDVKVLLNKVIDFINTKTETL